MLEYVLSVLNIGKGVFVAGFRFHSNKRIYFSTRRLLLKVLAGGSL